MLTFNEKATRNLIEENVCYPWRYSDAIGKLIGRNHTERTGHQWNRRQRVKMEAETIEILITCCENKLSLLYCFEGGD